MRTFVLLIGFVNEWVGRIAGFLIVSVVLIILREVIARSGFNAPSLWADESMTYLAGMAYVLGGGYALLHRKHVLVDIAYQPIARMGPATKATADISVFIIFSLYCFTLIWFGWDLAAISIGQNESSGTLWNPPLWPVKATIPLAGLLLQLQAIANLLVDLGHVSDLEVKNER